MKKWDRRRVKPQPKFCRRAWQNRLLKAAGLWAMVQQHPRFSWPRWQREMQRRRPPA